MLGYEFGLPVIVQYWRSWGHLEDFARNTDDPHLQVWRDFWKRVGKDPRTGIWHETYLIRAGEFENVYGNMRPVGLGKAGTLVPLAEGVAARQRFRATAGS